MSKFTTTIKDVVDNTSFDEVKNIFMNYELSDYLTQEQIDVINSFGTWSKEKLARKIVEHYYFREIGFETWGHFKFRVNIFMKEIMEKYSKLIYSNSIKFDPLVNVDYTETFNKDDKGTSKNSGTSKTTATSANDSSNIYSDTPNSGLDNIKDGKYASNVTFNDINNKTDSNVTDSSTTDVSNNEKYVKTIKGNSGVSATAQALIKQYREVIFSVDNEIINELNVLFMGIFE